MREVFTYQGNAFSKVTYLAFPSGGRKGAGYQTPLGLFRAKYNIQVLLEVVYLAAAPELSSKRTSSLSLLGLVVPDLGAARGRFGEFNVTSLADVWETLLPENVLPVVNAYGTGLLPRGRRWVSWRACGVEVQPQG